MTNIAGAVLAGGSSSRMGVDKAQLQLNGKTLLEHMREILRQAGLPQIYISHPEHISDRIAGYGPLSGVHSLMVNLPTHYEHVIIVPVDMPGLTSLVISKLIDASDTAQLVRYRMHKMPFRLRVERRWQKLAESMLRQQDEVALGSFQSKIPTLELDMETADNHNCFSNINSPKDWRNFNDDR